MDKAGVLAQALFKSGGIPNLTDLIAKGRLPGSATGSIWANAIFRGAGSAFKGSEQRKPFAKPTFSVQVIFEDSPHWFDGTLEIEHFFSSSAVGYMSGQKQAYFFGEFTLSREAARGVVHPWLIGDLIEYIGVEQPLPMSWGMTSQLFPGSIDNFSKINAVRAPAITELRRAMGEISEAAVKHALANIIGESFVPKDWGGERSDLYTTRLTIDGAPISAAFLLKGPAVPGPMHISNLGKRGDQIVRLFDEPADLLILQHCDKVETPVVKMMRQFAVDATRPRRYCIIDGVDTYRILRAYGYLDSKGVFSDRPQTYG